MIFLAALLLCLAVPTKQATQSPCPGVLTLEDKTSDTRWFGQITLPPAHNHWLFMTIFLDKKADLLGNWLGEVTTLDNAEYKIDNPVTKVQRQPIRFFVKHDRDEPDPPKVVVIKVDGREICNANRPAEVPVPVAPPSVTTKESVPFNPQPTNQQPPSSSEPAQCGTVKVRNLLTLVVDGTPTLEGQWPWQTALYRTQGVNQNYICGGTLVSHRHVITAAHCVTKKYSRPVQKVDVTNLMVHLGKHDLVTSVIGVQFHFVNNIIVHPDYDTKTISRDLAILQLYDSAPYTDWVQPACLWPDQLADLDNIVGDRGSVVGWGSDGSGKLNLAVMPVVGQETCLRSKAEFYDKVTSDYTYCAGSRNGQSACNGDSGGGMFFHFNDAWHLRGLVSLALSKDNEATCDPEHYVVFTDLAKFLPWIRQNIDPY